MHEKLKAEAVRLDKLLAKQEAHEPTEQERALDRIVAAKQQAFAEAKQRSRRGQTDRNYQGKHRKPKKGRHEK
jgi:hypothetical protein